MVSPKKRKDETKEEFLDRASHAYYCAGYSIIETAKKLKVEPSVVYKYVVDNSDIVSSEEREQMIAFHNKGYTIKEISTMFGRSRKTVGRRLKSEAKCPAESCPRKILTDNDIKYMEDAYLKGVPVREIARKLDLSASSVTYRLTRMGIYKKDNINTKIKATKANIKRAKALKKKGYTLMEIAKRTGLSKSTVSSYLKK